MCYPSMHCRWYPSMPCSRSPGGSAPGEVPGPGGSAPGGRGSAGGGGVVAVAFCCGLLLCPSGVVAFCPPRRPYQKATFNQKATTPEGHNSGLVETPPLEGYCCRRYASYWNAFLLGNVFKSTKIPSRTWKDDTIGIFTVRKRSCGKVMFLHLFVSHSIHRGGVHPLGRHPLRRPLQRTVRILLECILVLLKILEDISPFCGVTCTPVLNLWWCLSGFQSEGGFPACLLPHLQEMESSDSPLVTSWQPV